ncbi:uncharacterized protein IL334_006293 [Kwoniella shivajii]|uniref:Uncharacterized protein n=1 Tax=Kwoniella shivajii TaxID=564305 RepID=A0ABZ1D5J1_9TREE|nr:hypothetical protein IL334_006293 [Kwoniella shivajii]
MSNKPSYAAIVSNSPPKSSAIISGASTTGGPSDAPPPYSEPNQHHNPIPHQTVLPPPTQHQQRNDIESASHGHGTVGWSPPPSYAVARSRALRRFWLAFLWAWLIWIFVGLLIGGGVSDISNDPSPGHHGHWDKNGEWHNDKGGVYLANGVVNVLTNVKDKAIGVIPNFN